MATLVKFPHPSEMDKKYVDSVHPSCIEELLIHVKSELRNVFSPSTEKERGRALHLASIVRFAQARLTDTQPQ